MKTIYKSLLFGIASMLCTSAMAQVSAYIFSQPNGTYTAITGGTVVATATANTNPGNLGTTVWNLPNATFPFSFLFNGTGYTGCNISCNGFITFGLTPPATSLGTPISAATAYDGAICAWGRVNSGVFNIGNGPFYTSEVRVEVLGTSPNRTVVIQYDNWRYSNGTGTSTWILDFQIRLSETSNAIHIVYGPGLMVGGSLTTGGFSSQVGLRGLTNADYNNRTNTAMVSFTASTAGIANNATQAFAITSGQGTGVPGMPPDGLTYKWVPACDINITSSGNNSVAPAICSGGSLTLTTNASNTYTWSTGNTTTTSIVVSPTATTTYSIAGTATNNCIATAFINVIVSAGVPVLAVAASTTQVCLGKAVTFTASGAVTYTWTGGVTNGVAFTPTATTTYSVVGENGCGTASAVTTVTVAPLQVSGLSSPNTICAGGASTLSVVAAANLYTWQPVNVSGSTPSLLVSPTVTTIYTVTASDGTCAGTTNLTVTANPVPTISTVASLTLVCPGESTTLTATGGVNYTWSPPGSGTGASIVVSPTTSLVYSAVGDNSLGCLGNSALVIIVGQQPTLTINPGNNLICVGGSVTLTAMGANNYQWTGGPPANVYVVTPGQTTVYNVTGTLNSSGCTDTETISVNVFDPVMAIAGNTAICKGGTTNFTASAPGEDPNSFSWNPGGIAFPVASGLSPQVTTIYTVTAMSSSLTLYCPVTGTVMLIVNPNPTVTTSASPTTICKNQVATLSAGGASSYTWSNSTSTLGAAATLTVTAPNVSIITVSVTGTNVLGCKDTRVVSIAVGACTGIDEISGNTSALLVYPNPNNGGFMIESTFEENLTLVNELGQVVKHIQLSAQTGYKISVSNLANGIYFIADSKSGGVKQKVIVTK